MIRIIFERIHVLRYSCVSLLPSLQIRVVSLLCPNVQITLQLITINDPPVKGAIRPRAQRLIATPIVPCATKYHDNERDTIANTNVRSVPSVGVFMKLSANILGSWTQPALLAHDWLPFMILYGPRTFEFENREVPPYPEISVEKLMSKRETTLPSVTVSSVLQNILVVEE